MNKLLTSYWTLLLGNVLYILLYSKVQCYKRKAYLFKFIFILWNIYTGIALYIMMCKSNMMKRKHWIYLIFFFNATIR